MPGMTPSAAGTQRLPLLLVVAALVLAALSMYSIVPRISLVEAVTLFATAFGAGAGMAATITSARRRT